MAKHWSYFLFLLWICYLIISGVLMFTRGFLLNRDAFSDSSSCTPYSQIPCTPATSNSVNITNGHEYHCSQQDKLQQLLQDVQSASKICLPKKAKVILLVVDALRYDFATFDPDLENPAPFQNKLPILYELLRKSNHAKLYKFIADPPTTTMQRLKALTTGGLPTFIDAGSNFDSAEITEDNIIDQLRKHNKNIVFMGDDTWLNLFPKRFTRAWPFPSFNVWDLDTVDNGIMKHLHPELSTDDWTLLIAHFLGVDHCGHRYGPYHSEMERKLTELNEIIKNVVNNMDDDTMLFVIGDHGMTNTGDHGGDSDLEVTSTLFFYSPTPLVSFEHDTIFDAVKQVDLIPTLSSILGIPVPYSNLGSVILDAFPIVNSTKSTLSNWQTALIALWTNVAQTTNYINRYSANSNQLNGDQLELLKMKYNTLKNRVNHINNESQFKGFLKDAKQYLVSARQTCEDVWIQFDSFSMSRGLLIVFLTIFFVYMVIDGIPYDKLSQIFVSSFLLCAYVMVAIAAGVSFICYSLSVVDNFELTLFFSTGMISVLMLAILVIQNWESIANQWYECTRMRKWLDIVTRLILVLFVCTLFSNSYILQEANVLSFLLLASVISIIYNTIILNKIKINNLKSQWNPTKTKLVIIGFLIGALIRFSMQYWRCREEQNEYCITSSYVKSNKDATKLQCIVTLVFLAVFVTVTRIWLRSCGNLVGFSSTVTLARYTPTVIVVCTAGFWVLHRLPKETKFKLVAPWQVDILAWTVYVLVAIGLLSIVMQPLCIYVLPKKRESVMVYGQENIIPQLFNQVKESYDEKRGEDGTKDMPIVYGLGTVYSAAFIVTSIVLLLLMSLLLGDEHAPAAVIMYFTAAAILVIITVSQYEKASNISQLFDVPGSSVLCWVLLSHYFFYGTGHQPAFQYIRWEAAFVGTDGNFSFNFVPALLIGINTFASYILMGVTLPLLLIGPFTLYIMFPHLASNKSDKDLRRGDLLVYENDNLLMRGMFSLACKYMLFHGIRMFACMLAVTIHCRHLMVWSIFAPRFIFEGISLMVTVGSVLTGYLLLIRVNNKVDQLVKGLEKQTS